jgi:hypothetical protein
MPSTLSAKIAFQLKVISSPKDLEHAELGNGSFKSGFFSTTEDFRSATNAHL